MSMRRLLLRLLLLSGIVAGVLWAGLNREHLDLQALDARLAGMGIWAPAVYAALYATGTVIFFPGSLFALAGGALFGPVWGAILNLLGATVGATAAFLVARYVASDWVARKAAGRLKRLIAGVEAEGWRFVAFVRLVPLFPFNLTNYALGLTRIGLVPYIATSLVCMAPGAIAYTWLGHAGREALAGNETAIRYGLIALALLATIAFLPRLVRRLRGDGSPRWIEVDDLARRLESGSGVAVIDVRAPDEFVGSLGHIAGARNLPISELPQRLHELDTLKDNPVVVLVCRTDRRSANGAAHLRDAGFRDVRVLRGGMERWNAEGFPVSTP